MQILDILGNLEIPARTCPGKRGCMVTLVMTELATSNNDFGKSTSGLEKQENDNRVYEWTISLIQGKI